MAGETSNIDQPTGQHAEAATTDVVAKAKVLAEAAQTAVIEQGDKVKAKVVGATATTNDSHVTESDTTKQGDNVKDKVVGTVADALDATKTGVAEGVDKAQGYLNQGGPTHPAPAEGKE